MHNQKRIDFFRGVAILAVFTNHLSIVCFGNYEVFFYKGLLFDFQAYPAKRVILNFLPPAYAYAGLELFLVISGFLIHMGFLKAGSRFGFYRFFNKRFWRIVPPYLLALCIFTPLFFSGWWDVLAHVTFTHNLFHRFQFSINPSYWSLGLEVQLYLMYPLFLWLRRNWGMQKSLWLIGSVSLLAGGAGAVLGTTQAALQLSVFIYWIMWVAGAYLAEQYIQGKRLSRLNGYHFSALLVCLLLLKVFSIGFYLSPFLFALYFMFLLDWVLHTRFQLSQPVRWGVRFVASVGVCSYSVYLLHQPFLDVIYNGFLIVPHQYWAQAVACLASFLLIYGVSQLYYRWVEVPSIRFGAIFYNKMTALRKTGVFRAIKYPGS